MWYTMMQSVESVDCGFNAMQQPLAMGPNAVIGGTRGLAVCLAFMYSSGLLESQVSQVYAAQSQVATCCMAFTAVSPLGSPTPSDCPGGCSRPTYPSPSSTHRQFTGGRELFFHCCEC
jgi:hypothetical protein